MIGSGTQPVLVVVGLQQLAKRTEAVLGGVEDAKPATGLLADLTYPGVRRVEIDVTRLRLRMPRGSVWVMDFFQAIPPSVGR